MEKTDWQLGYLDGYLAKAPKSDKEEYLRGYEVGVRDANRDRVGG